MANTTAYGFYQAKDFFAMRAIDYGFQTITTMVEESVALYNRQLEALKAMMVEQTFDYKLRVTLPGGGFMQPIDDDGNPKPVKSGGSYDVAYPMRMYGTAWGTNRISRAKMTVADANQITLDALARDMRTQERRMLAALFTNVSWTFTDDKYGALTIQPLALTADGVTYLGGDGTMATAQHYVAQANAISNTDDPYATLFALLDRPASNVGDKVAFIPTNLVATTVALAKYYPAADQNIQYGSGVSVARAPIEKDNPITNSPLISWGDRLLGYHADGIWLVEKKSLPSSYIVSIVDGTMPVLAERIEPEAELQGLFPEYHDIDGNHEVNRLIRRNGYAVKNRVGAAIMRVGNGTYAIPTGYDTRLATWS